MLGGVGDEVSVMTVVHPRGKVSVSSLGYFSSVGSSSKPYHPSLPIYLGFQHIKDYFNKKRKRKRKFTKPLEEKASHKEWRKQMRVKIRAKLVVGYWELIPMESGADNPAYQDTAIVTKGLEGKSENRKRNSW